MALATAAKGATAVMAGLGAAATYRYQALVQRQGQLPSNSLQVFAGNQPKAGKKRVLVIGAGVVGVSTAYKLALKGHQVVVLEPAPEPGEECSWCAAGGMQRQNVVVNKDSWIAVLKCIAPQTARLIFGGQPEPFKFFQMAWGPSLSDPFFLRWVLTFTKTSLIDPEPIDKQQEMLQFTKFAVADIVNMMEHKRNGMAKAAGYNTRGSLAVSYDANVTPPKPNRMNLEPYQMISAEEALTIEPSLRFQEQQLTAAKQEMEAKSAHSGRFSKELARWCIKLNVNFQYETKVQGITVVAPSDQNQKPRIGAIQTNRGVIEVPSDVHVVVAAGAWTPHVLALMDLYAPVYPLKGYAMSVSAKEALAQNPSLKPHDLPSRIVCDKYMYTTRLGDDEIRITSIGEFSEWNTQPTPHVDQEFRREAIRQFPQLASVITKAPTRCGHRPFVNDGLLLLGAVDTHDNLYVSAGPGSNGWKLCMGSGEVIQRLVDGQTTEEMAQELGFDAMAFSPAGRVLHSPWFAKLCRARWDV